MYVSLKYLAETWEPIAEKNIHIFFGLCVPLKM